MKKIAVVVSVCAVLLSFNICGEDMGVVSAHPPWGRREPDNSAGYYQGRRMSGRNGISWIYR